MQATASYRRTRTGAWVVMGPTSLIRAGADVTVTKRSGETKTEHIASVGKAFRVDGHEMIYGYITERATRTPRRRWEGCEDCQWVEDAGDANGCSRHRGNPAN